MSRCVQLNVIKTVVPPPFEQKRDLMHPKLHSVEFCTFCHFPSHPFLSLLGRLKMVPFICFRWLSVECYSVLKRSAEVAEKESKEKNVLKSLRDKRKKIVYLFCSGIRIFLLSKYLKDGLCFKSF